MKPGGSKEDKTNVLKTGGSYDNSSYNYSAGQKYCRNCSGAFCNTFDLHDYLAIISLENIFLGLLLSDCLRQILLYMHVIRKKYHILQRWQLLAGDNIYALLYANSIH